MLVSTERDSKGLERYYLDECYTWNQFEKLVSLVCLRMGGVVARKLDGPGERVWYVTIGTESLTFRHDDMSGNCVYPSDPNSTKTLEMALRVFTETPAANLGEA